MADRVGQQFGPYRLARLLGQGSLAETYFGEHAQSKMPVVIKVERSTPGGKAGERIFGLAHLMASLAHPGILRVLDAGQQGAAEGTVAFLVVPFASQGNIRRRLPPGSMLPPHSILTYVRQIADALQYAHDKGIVHGDVKPENILFGPNGELWLSDFGAYFFSQGLPFQGNQSISNPFIYMAPEQWQGNPIPRSDQYALGVLIYEWLSGDTPFHGSPEEIARQRLSAAPPSLRQKIPALPADVERVLMTALERDPQRRFMSIKAFARALEVAFETRPPLAVPPISAPVGQPSLPAVSGAPPFQSIPGVSSNPLAPAGNVSMPAHVPAQAGSAAIHAAQPPPLEAPRMPPSPGQHQPPVHHLPEQHVPAQQPQQQPIHQPPDGHDPMREAHHHRDDDTRDARSQQQEHAQRTSKHARHISRRAVIGGAAGLVILAGGGLALLAYTKKLPGGNGNGGAPPTPHIVGQHGTWHALPDLFVARSSFRATTLRSGQVLIEGGLGQSPTNLYLAESELFDPATGKWTRSGNLKQGRYGHSATLLPGGGVLVAGGWSEFVSPTGGVGFGSQNTVEIFDPARGAWALHNGIQQRLLHTATLLPGGKVLLVGGYNETPLNTAEVYDPLSGSSTPTGNLTTFRAEHTAVLLHDGRVLVAGSPKVVVNGALGYSPTCEIYDPATNTWTATGSMHSGRAALTAVLLPDGRVLAAGGDTLSGATASAEVYDPTTGQWSLTGSMHQPRHALYAQNAMLLGDGTVFIAGGDASGTSEVYIPATGTWNTPLKIGQQHSDGAATQLQDGRVLLVGGDDFANIQNKQLSAALYA